MTSDEIRKRFDKPEIGFAIQFTLMITALTLQSMVPVLILLLLAGLGLVEYLRRKSERKAANPRIDEVCVQNPHTLGNTFRLCPTDGSLSTDKCDRYYSVSSVIEELLVQRNQLIDAVAYYQALDDMHQQEAAKRAEDGNSGIHLKGWWCNRLIESRYPDTKGQLVTCDTFNGEQHSTHSDCRHCGQPKVNPNPRIDNVQARR